MTQELNQICIFHSDEHETDLEQKLHKKPLRPGKKQILHITHIRLLLYMEYSFWIIGNNCENTIIYKLNHLLT